MARLLHPKPAWMVVGMAAVVLCGLLSGCGETYPSDMAYGVRTDLIWSAKPKENPASMGVPGQWLIQSPAFQTGGGQTLDPGKLSAEQRSNFDTTLTELFGKPAAPKVDVTGDVVVKKIRAKMQERENEDGIKVDALAWANKYLSADTLTAGSKLYRQHCLHCHGLTGDGQGPTAAWVNPHPRDYRPGKFKFTSSSQPAGDRKPRREDLLRVLRQGIEGTSMPSFGLLPEDQLEKLAAYVTHLSLRGQCEADAMAVALAQNLGQRGIDNEIKNQLADVLVKGWVEADTWPGWFINPKSPYPYSAVPGNVRTEAQKTEMMTSIRNGHRTFLGGGVTSCISCHKDYGRTPNLMWDDWGTVVRPADLTTGIFRGGRRPIDIFWRIHSGINGTGMPSIPGTTPEKDMWDVVNFVLALPYPEMLPPDIRNQIYPHAEKPSATAKAD